MSICRWPSQLTISKRLTQQKVQTKQVATQTKLSLPTFQQMPHECKIEVGVKIESHKVVHLLAVPLQGPPDLHEDFLRALLGSQKCTGLREKSGLDFMFLAV